MKITRRQLRRIIKEELNGFKSNRLDENRRARRLAMKNIDSATNYFVEALKGELKRKGFEYVDLNWKGKDDTDWRGEDGKKFKIETGDSQNLPGQKFISFIAPHKESCLEHGYDMRLSETVRSKFADESDVSLFKWKEPGGFQLNTGSSHGCKKIGTSWGGGDRGSDVAMETFYVVPWTEEDANWASGVKQ